MSASDKFERLIDQYIQVDDDGSVRLKGVRQPRFSDLMKLASIVQNIKAQRDANAPPSSFAGRSDEQLVDDLATMLGQLDTPTLERVLLTVGERKPDALALPSFAHLAPGEGAREEREPTEGEERYSVSKYVQPVPSDEDTPRTTSTPPPVSHQQDRKQGASARTRAAARGLSGSSARSEGKSHDGAPTLSPGSLRRKAKE